MEKQNHSKIILHVDMNAFFCSVAAILNPSLRGKAFAIGRENSYRGVLSTASYEARALGIHSAMSQKEAYELAPDLIIVSLDYSNYVHFHQMFLDILNQYSNLVEVASIDEAFLDISEASKTRHPLVIAKEIQARILKETGLSCSIGVAPTLFLAKMASDMKKPLGLTVLRKRDVKNILYPLSVSEIYGIGKKTYPVLIKNGIKTIEDFMEEDNRDKIIDLIGINSYSSSYNRIIGNSSDIVDPNRYSEIDSISTSQTYDRIINSQTEALYELRKLTRSIYNRLVNKDYYAKTITITFKYTDFKVKSRSKTLEFYTNDYNVIYDVVVELIEEHYNGEDVRLLGVGLSNIVEKEKLPQEYNLFTITDFDERQQKIKQIINEYQNKYGEKALFQNKNKS